jgi:hypothetical protein
MAIKTKSITKGLFHSMREVFNASKITNVVDFTKIITRSMSRKGTVGTMNSEIFKTLKTEIIYGNKLISKEQMERDIFELFEIWYNRKRSIHFRITKQLKNLKQKIILSLS